MDASADFFTLFNELAIGVTLSVSPDAGTCRAQTVSAAGDIETGNAGRFQEALLSFLAARPAIVLLRLDISRVSYVSSIGIGALASIHRTLMERQGGLALHSASPRLRELIKQLGFSELLGPEEQQDEEAVGAAHSLFPRTLPCPQCKGGLQVARPGRFRCRLCGTVFVVDGTGDAV
jgi:anti-anti-sigma factor